LIGFLMHKIWKNKWLMLCLILGNIILIGVVTVVPLFTTATMQRVFQEDLRYVQETQNTFPAMISIRFNANAAPLGERYSIYLASRDVLVDRAVEDMGVPTLFGIRTYALNNWRVRPAVARELPNSNRTLSLVAPEGFEQHIRLIYGRMPSDELVEGNIIEVLARSDEMFRHNLLLGELMIAPDVTHQDGRNAHLRIVGAFELLDGSETYWSAVPMVLHNSLLISESLVSDHFLANPSDDLLLTSTWTHVLDWEEMRIGSIPHYRQSIYYSRDFFNTQGGIWFYSVNFYDTMGLFTARTEHLSITLLVLQIPIYVMLALFMYMVTKQILLLDSNDISVLKSRGASRRQILGIYALQGLFVAAVSFPIGLGFGVALCHAIGSSSGFLELVNREALTVDITGQAILYAAIGMAISYLYLLLPVINLSRVAILDHKRSKARKSAKPLWQRYFLDVLIFAAAVLVLYNYNAQREIMMSALHEVRSYDPLLFAGSSLFIIGTALLLLRLYPYFMRLIYHAGRKWFGPAVYASMVKVSRSGGGEQFIMLFLVFTVAVGVFSAQAARTLNLDNAHRIQYLSGTDLMIRQAWRSNMPSTEMVAMGLASIPDRVEYIVPDTEQFFQLEEVYAITRVLRRSATVRMDRSVVNDVALMGIETDSFGETSWFRNDLLPIHINHFLNVLAVHPDGVLLSSNFHYELGYRIGDSVVIIVPIAVGLDLFGRFEIVGFVDHWPTFQPVRMSQLDTGELIQETRSLAVANLGHLQLNWGVLPYQLWMRTNGVPHQFMYDFIAENRISVAEFYDTSRSLTEMLSDPLVQSTNGVLTISFIMTMLLCMSGFLIYWILSIKGRLLQFGVFRAMGLGRNGIMSILISEQVLITISALIIGGIIGEATSRLFVPLVQLSYTAADQVIPLLIVMEPMDYITIYGILGFMLVLCVSILARYTLRVNVSQVLKLGED